MLHHNACASDGSLDPSCYTNTRASLQATKAATARNASERRRYVDPTTCERDYHRDELDFMNAMQAYKKSSGRMFPTWSEVLEVLKAIGYEKARTDREDRESAFAS